MPTARLRQLNLTDFRSYERAVLPLNGRPAYLFGPNGAGKTNLLEAVSLLAPGRGLRNAALAEVGRRLPGEARGRAWAVAVTLETDDGNVQLGTGTEAAGATRRVVRLEGEPATPGRLTDFLRLVWLTPQQDRLFMEGAADRRRFFDRLVFAARPGHAAQAGAYERALRERMRLLTDGPADPAWLTALEAQLAETGGDGRIARWDPGRTAGRDRPARRTAVSSGCAFADRRVGADGGGGLRARADPGPIGCGACGLSRA